MGAFDELKRISESDEEILHGLAARYRRMGREYAALARTVLADGAVWDGGGKGAVNSYWLKLIQYEHQREGIRVSRLGDMLNAIESKWSSPQDALDAAMQWANQHHCETGDARMAVEAEWLRVGVVNGITKLHHDVYSGSTAGQDRFVPSAAEDAQKILRGAVELDRR